MKTDKELKDAIKFLKDYKKYFQLDDDDVQELLIKFNQYYDSTKGTISTFLVPIIRNHNYSKWRATTFAKNAHTAIPIDNITQDDDRQWLMAKIATEDHLLEDKETQDGLIEIIKLALNCLTKTQMDIIVELYFNHMTNSEVANKFNMTHQNCSQHHMKAIKRMKKYLEKNNINVTF